MASGEAHHGMLPDLLCCLQHVKSASLQIFICSVSILTEHAMNQLTFVSKLLLMHSSWLPVTTVFQTFYTLTSPQ